MLLHLKCIQRNECSRRTFRSLIFYITYPFVRHYKDIFGIHVNTQTVVTFWILVRVRRVYVFTCYVPGIIHTLPTYNDRGSMILVHIMWYYRLVLLLTAACCRSSTFVCIGQRLVRARVVLWSTGTPGFSSMKHFASFPSGLVEAYFFIYRVFSFF